MKVRAFKLSSVKTSGNRRNREKRRTRLATNLICMNQHHESIPLTAGIFLIDKKIMDQLGSVWDEMVKIPKQIKLLNGCR